ncbi:nitrilase-related carbon-nitrogen hydrolase [Thermovibrio sp.]
MKFKAYALQFESLKCEFQKNYSTLLTLLNFCKPNSLVVAPEVAATGFCYDKKKEAVKFSEKVFKELLDFSKGLSITVVITGYEEVNGKLFNSVKVFDRGRELLSRPKVKLFKPGGEGEHFKEGSMEDLKVVETSVGVLAPVICFELRFWEVLKRLKEMGGEVFTVPAQWGRARREHWETILRARAIELQRFFIGANGSGKEMAGSSAIVDPWGRVIAQAKDGTSLIEGEVNLPLIEQVEKKLPLNS